MIKQCLTACAILVLSFSSTSAFAVANASGSSGVQWQAENSWKLPGKPIDLVYSLDSQRVFILTDQQQVLVYAADGNLLGTIEVKKGVSSIDIAPRGERLYLLNEVDNSFTDLSVDFIVNIDTAGSPFLGKTDAPVTLTIFTDFQCPHCSKAVPLLEQVLEHNPDTVKIVFKNMPLNFHKLAVPAALAALAAGNQGKFWEYHDELFATPKLNQSSFQTIAKKLGLDFEKLENDMNSPAIQQQLAKDLQDAKDAGVTGTPTIFINGAKLKKRELSAIQKTIDEILAK